VINLARIARDLPWLRPRWAKATRATLRSLVGVSTPMLLIQVGGILINEAQILIMTQVSGLESVTDYSIWFQVFQAPVLVVAHLENPLVPMYREAYARRDHSWLRARFWSLQRLKGGVSLVAAGLYLTLGNSLVHLLSGHRVDFSAGVWAATGALLLVGTWNGGFNHLFMAVDRLWALVGFMLANGVVTATLTYLFASRWGLTGVIIATTTFSALVTGWVMPLMLRGVLADRPAPGAPAARPG
jgi:O-antigen/teichoic acid export membrane protein